MILKEDWQKGSNGIVSKCSYCGKYDVLHFGELKLDCKFKMFNVNPQHCFDCWIKSNNQKSQEIKNDTSKE
jgi:hypothetical protein